MSRPRWELRATFTTERAAQSAAAAIRASADHVSVESWTWPPPTSAPKASDHERAIAAIDRFCTRVAKWNAVWEDAGKPPRVMWSSYYDRQGWAGHASLRGTGYQLDRLNAWIELLRAARTLLRERLGVADDDGRERS